MPDNPSPEQNQPTPPSVTAPKATPPEPALPQPTLPEPTSPESTAPEYTPGRVSMAEEFDKAKWTMPPVLPVAIAAIAILVIGGVVAFTTRPKPIMTCSIDKIARVDQGDSTIVAVRVELENVSDKQAWVRDIDSEVLMPNGKRYTNHSAPASEINGYLKALPALQEAKADPMGGQLKVPAKGSFTGVIVFSYPIDGDAFDGRKSFTLKIALYDQPTLVVQQP